MRHWREFNSASFAVRDIVVRYMLRPVVLLLLATSLFAQDVQVRAGLPSGPQNNLYTGNRPPLRPLPLVKLPVGAVVPGGWLREQMRLMGDGFSGRLPELSQFCKYDGNAWTDPSGHGRFGWEELPYWLKGYINLGYVMKDPRIIAESTKWVEAVLKTQRDDGYFGASANLTGKNTLDDLKALDLWPNMVMLYVLRTHYEATGDARIIPFMQRFYRWFMKQELYEILPSSWQKYRGGDNLDHIYWLYSRTGEPWLLEAARINHERTADWVGGIPTWHGVNFSECFREPAQYYQQTNDARYLHATERNYDTMMRIYGQAPGGGFGSDENARPGYTGPRQATETCTWVEFMFSHEMLASITGDSKWADRAEEIAFNSLPASMTPDLKGLHYLTAPNQVRLDRANKAPSIENNGDMFSYDPYGYRCCQHNTAMGWPYYAERQWMGTSSNGLAAVFYSTNTVKAKVGGGEEVVIDEKTGYPFESSVQFTLKTAKPVRFPLALRIPAWCDSPTLKLNGNVLQTQGKAEGWLTVERPWSNGDVLELTVPMKVSVKRWPSMKDAASVHYGPLGFSLKIDEDWRAYGDSPNWQKYEVFAKSDWNYALVLEGQPVLSRKHSDAEQPFTPGAAPLEIKARGRIVPEWRIESNGMTGEIQQSPVKASDEARDITLIPMGAARLRVTMFPVAGGEKRWDPNPPVIAASNTSHYDQPHLRGFSWAGRLGTREWIEQRYSTPREFRWAAVKWADDAEPQSWRLLAWSDSEWREVSAGAGERVEFPPVTTTALRLEIKMPPRRGVKLMEWRAGAAKE